MAEKAQSQGRDERTQEDHATPAVHFFQMSGRVLAFFHTFSGPPLPEMQFYRNFFPTLLIVLTALRCEPELLKPCTVAGDLLQ